MKCDIAREAALKILYEINEKGAYSNIALNKHFSFHDLSGRDRAFITELVYGVVRWKLTLDRTIAACSDIKMEKLSPWIRNILRLGTYQLLYLDKVPLRRPSTKASRLPAGTGTGRLPDMSTRY